MRNKTVLFLVSLLIAGSAFAAIWYYCSDYPARHDHTISPSHKVSGLADGDLIFRTGRDMMARMVLTQGNAIRFSHVGIIVQHNSMLYVVHAVPKEGKQPGGVVMETLDTFVSEENAQDVGYFQVRNINARTRAAIRSYAQQQVGKPFDMGFQFSDDDRMYCSELVVKAFEAGGIKIRHTLPTIQVMTLSEPVYTPDDLSRSPFLIKINSV